MRFLLLVFLVFFLSFTSDHDLAADDSVQALKIDIAGRQRMLSQRIAKAACYISTYSDVDMQIDALKKAVDLFEKSHYALQFGDPSMGLPKEDNVSILRELQKIDKNWHLLEFGAKSLLDMPTFPGVDMDLIAEFNLPVLRQANMAVQFMENVYSKDETLNAGLVRAINIAGRQRMLTQKAAKEFCLLSYGLNVKENQKNLKTSIRMFDQALDDLRDGNPAQNIPPAPSEEIHKKLVETKSNWQAARATMLSAANGRDAHSMDFRIISYANEAMLRQSNEIVQMLVKFASETVNGEETIELQFSRGS
ncbi:type IV pili methyl-accepting chemotaxis transducer N-terminal domain-containing protein [Terasakiella sp. A23]|uniref:type IV pili methyl-accepting chemotaxis transducer N-terminal domain-containing protein n=1 Tax=Terasakiella sp. FCG-A23 TaxID=3080561 RepID=UPI00295383A2|nr:type IV pili methyl-accepting chemotaxis transducer N-terminal domain-containing protein [Terasakiella sp. A23]MDV7340775.1 type IV pili methyl-accepting chemotaxis transducer N-terminal domain-containing protein [Terasakiella sp. A23]